MLKSLKIHLYEKLNRQIISRYLTLNILTKVDVIWATSQLHELRLIKS